jgi:glutamine cyclotransferase
MPKNNYIQAGWGMACTKDIGTNAEVLVVSDGTNKLKIVDVETWTHLRTVTTELQYINELESIPETSETPTGISKYVLANAFHSNSVHMISLETGIIVASWDLSDLQQTQMDYVDEQMVELKAKFGDRLFGK